MGPSMRARQWTWVAINFFHIFIFWEYTTELKANGNISVWTKHFETHLNLLQYRGDDRFSFSKTAYSLKSLKTKSELNNVNPKFIDAHILYFLQSIVDHYSKKIARAN